MPDRLLTRRVAGGLAAAAAATAGIAGIGRAETKLPLIGTYGGAGCTGVPQVAAFEAWLGRPMDVVLDFLDVASWPKMLSEVGWIAGCWRGAKRRALVISVPMLVHEGKPTMKEGAAGAYDAHFRAVAAKMIEGGFPNAVMRIGWEFNGNWYPWSAHGAPDLYAAYWRRIATTMRAVPGARFRFDWTATTADGPTNAAYPGDDVVDIIGLDVYSQSWPFIAEPDRRWAYLLRHRAGLEWHRDFARAHGKPRSFPEWGTGTRPDGHGGGDDPLFIRNMLAWMREGGPVDYACYWNYRAGDYDAKLSDGRLPEAGNALREGLRRG